MLISFDTETNGLDLQHGARPFMVSVCDFFSENTLWEWDVDPETRLVDFDYQDVEDIYTVIDQADEIVLQHGKFDLKAMTLVQYRDWPWHKIHDTLFAGHLLKSNQAHDLTTMASVYAGLHIKPFEDVIQEHANAARKIARTKLKHWRIAQIGLPEMPSVKSENKKKTSTGVESESPWKNDMWLPKAICRLYPELLPETDNWKQGNKVERHPWWSSCGEYCNADTAATVQVWINQKEKLKKLGLWEIYLARIEVMKIIYNMEMTGITVSKKRLNELRNEYEKNVDAANSVCLAIAKKYNYELEMPRGPNNKSLRTFCFDKNLLNLPIISWGKKDPSLDKHTIDDYENTLEEGSDQLNFVRNLKLKRKRGKSLEYIEGWMRYAIQQSPDVLRLFPSVNPTGTTTLRSSSSNPSEQVISKQQDAQGKSLRYGFGPAPGRGWACLDYENLELRIPAYECGEPAMLELFENPDAPPYYGKYHLLVFDILHPDLFANHGKDVTEVYKDTWYQWTKNGNFAEMYGAVDRPDGKGTADLAFHMPGAQSKIAKRLVNKTKLNQHWIQYAEKRGYVETLPDKGLGHKRGYPLYCSRTSWGKITPTVPLNYHVQGTACWIKMRAMVKCNEYLNEVKRTTDEDWYIIMDIHDEIVFDFPLLSNYRPKIRKLKALMQSCGDDVGVPLKVGVDIHLNNWNKGVSLDG